jgi:hypothetical protein
LVVTASTRCCCCCCCCPSQLRTEYIGVMGRVLSGHFKTYLAALEKMEAPVAGTDTCTVVDKGGASTSFSSSTVKNHCVACLSCFLLDLCRGASSCTRLVPRVLCCLHRNEDLPRNPLCLLPPPPLNPIHPPAPQVHQTSWVWLTVPAASAAASAAASQAASTA